MELNGIANIKMLTEVMDKLVKEDKSQFGEWAAISDKIKEQCDLLERYMLAYKNEAEDISKIAGVLIETPYWHEVREKTSEYPTLKESLNKQEES